MDCKWQAKVNNVRIRPGRMLKGSWIEARERFSSDENFGSYAKAIRSWDRAKELYDQAEKEKYNRFAVV